MANLQDLTIDDVKYENITPIFTDMAFSKSNVGLSEYFSFNHSFRAGGIYFISVQCVFSANANGERGLQVSAPGVIDGYFLNMTAKAAPNGVTALTVSGICVANAFANQLGFFCDNSENSANISLNGTVSCYLIG